MGREVCVTFVEPRPMRQSLPKTMTHSSLSAPFCIKSHWRCLQIFCIFFLSVYFLFSSTLGASTAKCKPGYKAEKGENSEIACIPCPDGFFSSNTNADECLPCPRGQVTHFSPGNNVKCFQCPLGETTDSEGSSQCVNCPPGSIGDKKNAGLCLECPKGTFQTIKKSPQAVARNDKSKRERICQRCPNGSVTREGGMVKCEKCDEGTVPNWKRTECRKLAGQEL
mmetsp:Transcript_1415/g.4842  ORF Transcript_1415/g.4842 Transcript_1415/m.4842 type:complete len:224 (-) Transcript_1415:164-835(-)